MLNSCSFIGRLGKDPEGKTLSSGGRVVNFSIAVSERWTSKDGEKKERTTWVPIVIWNENLGEVAERYLRKGSMVFITGAFITRKWTDASGTEKYTTEIVLQRFRGEMVMLSSRTDGDASAGNGNGNGTTASKPFNDALDIPF
jgi:single-strand DNA-binding protein